MKYSTLCVFGLVSLALASCKSGSREGDVVSQRYVHKYGYAIAEEDWAAKNYPGQEISVLKNGVTVTTTYENGIQHGPTTYTYPHSQMVERFSLYNLGTKVKEITYDPAGVPMQEWVQLSPTRHSITLWYAQGSPMRVEEFVGDELLDGQYFTVNNLIESRVEKGAGIRILRNREGILVGREGIEEGYAIRKEMFYPNGSPESIAYYSRGKLHGEKRTFAETGEPLSIEEFVNHELHGKATYFKNGNRYLETYYLHGQKNGIEKHYVDGDTISREVPWENGKEHGEVVFYSEGKQDSEWYYAGQKVTRHKFNELNRLDAIISRLPYSSDAQDVR